MIHNFNNFVNESLGSSLTFSARVVGQGKNGVRPKVWGEASRRARKGVGGRNFCPPASVPVPFEQRKSGRGFGGNSAFPLRNQNEASPATCPNTWRAEHRRKILFSLRRKKKSGARKMKRAKSIFLWCGELVEQWRGWLPYWGFCSKKFEHQSKTPPIFTFCEIIKVASAQSASAWYFSAFLKAFLKSKTKVRSAMRKFLCESTEKTKFSEPIFFFRFQRKVERIFL